MQKTILITGSTDGIGLETAKMLGSQGHCVLLHGRDPAKLENAEQAVLEEAKAARVECYIADLSRKEDVEALAQSVTEKHTRLDALINNAGVFLTPKTVTPEGLDVRFVVNTIAPYLLMQRLLPLLGTSGRVINVSTAAQSTVEMEALAGEYPLPDGSAYAQSKLALTMWSHYMADSFKVDGPVIIAVNPGSMLASKLIKEAFADVKGGDLRKGADILTRAALSDEFADASGEYFNNDSGKFTVPHPHILDLQKSEEVVRIIETLLAEKM